MAADAPTVEQVLGELAPDSPLADYNFLHLRFT
jgi:hypothetical protein